MLLLLLNDIVSIILISLIRLSEIWIDLDRVGEPARIIPTWLQIAASQWALLEKLGLVTHSRIDSHVLQVSRSILILD